MKRGGTIKRRTRLRGTSGPRRKELALAQRTAGLTRAQRLGRSECRRSTRTKRASRREHAAAEIAFRVNVLARAQGRCERCGAFVRLEAHHIVPRSRGVGWEFLHDPEINGAALCISPRGGCHRLIHEGDPPDRALWIRSRPKE